MAGILRRRAAAGGVGWLMSDVAKSREGGAPRFPQLTMEQLTEAQKPLGEQIMKVSSVELGGPYNPMLRSPALGQRMFDLLRYLRWWRSQVEWSAHAPLAIKAGLVALEALKRRDRIDLLFTDVVMPGGLNGRQLADEAQSLRPGLRVLFTTGYTRNAIVHHGRLDPGVSLIGKPFSFEGLAAKIRSVLDEK